MVFENDDFYGGRKIEENTGENEQATEILSLHIYYIMLGSLLEDYSHSKVAQL